VKGLADLKADNGDEWAWVVVEDNGFGKVTATVEASDESIGIGIAGWLDGADGFGEKVSAAVQALEGLEAGR
jgi:hypothetical protein